MSLDELVNGHDILLLRTKSDILCFSFSPFPIPQIHINLVALSERRRLALFEDLVDISDARNLRRLPQRP